MIIFLVATPICLFLAVASGGGGHGNYFWAKVLFPFTMLSASLTGSIDIPFIILAIVQYPRYRVILGLASKRGWLTRVAAQILVAHVLAAAICVFVPDENFSRYERSSARSHT